MGIFLPAFILACRELIHPNKSNGCLITPQAAFFILPRQL
jgi:hypothetical protein